MSEQRGRSAGGSGGGLPAAPQRIPGLPENAAFFELSRFRTLNRQVSRASIGDEDMAWCHNLVPIADGYLRTILDNDPATYTAHNGLQMGSFDFLVNSENQRFSLVFLSDGSAQQVDLATTFITDIAPPGTFSTGIAHPPAMIQAGLSGGTVAVIVSPQIGATDPNDGFFIWDGMSLFQAGTVSPVTTLTDGGHNYTSAPTVGVFGGSGTGAAFTAEVSFGSVVQVKATSPGSGYLPTDSAILIFSGGGQGTSAYGLGATHDGVITSLTLVSGGSGYSTASTITITPIGGGSGASAIITGISGGIITSVQMLDGGFGYSSGATVTAGGPGSGAVLFPVIEDGVVYAVNMISTGSGYSSPPSVHYISTSGSGAGGTVVVLNGQVTGVRFDFPSQGGSGYETPPIVQFIGGGGPASGTVSLMPFGVKGTAIETYVGRVWIANGNRIFFTAPQSLVDFGNGGGVFQDTDSFQKFEYRNLKQSNGFLYLISDSSVNYISGVTTTGSPPITTFTNLNIDPQIGASWKDSVTVFSRQIALANSKGVFTITGGAVQKLSPQLDRLFYDPPPDLGINNYPPSSAVMEMYATDHLMFLTPVFDPVAQVQRVLFLVWNGHRWSTASQSANILWINTFQADSRVKAYGTDGSSLYSLFLHPSNISKTLVSKLWSRPSIITEKKAWAIYALFECSDATTLNFEIDTETGTFSVTQGAFSGTGTVGQPVVTWARSSSLSPAGQTIGFTMTSQSPNFALLTALLVTLDYSMRT